MKRLHSIRKNLKLSILLLLIPFLIGLTVIGFVFTSAYRHNLAQLGAQRLVTDNWELADEQFNDNRPTYGRKYAYYRLKEGENLQKVAEHFSVDPKKLAELNPGTLVTGATVKITPLEAPLTPITAGSGSLQQLRISEEDGEVRIKHDYKSDKISTTLPELANFLAPYGVFEKTGDKTYRMNRSISVEENIRLDITGNDVELLEITSAPRSAFCLCFVNAEVLIKDTKITTYEPTTGEADKVQEDERSFIRAYKTARMDMVNSHISYLGNGLDVSDNPIQNKGGTYGISWRIPDDELGAEIVTGWVEGNTFYKNHFGSYTFGASGMVWKGNHYLENDVYGLDPHDDSNNALVEDNVFEKNGKHGFIVSKRCNYNVIRNNVSFGNKLHGYMLHQDSVYNVIEDNLAYDNADNFAIYDSDFNMVRNNRSFNARKSHIRVNADAANTFVMGNKLYGGRRGIYLYGAVRNAYVANNEIQSVETAMTTNQAQNVLFVRNTIAGLYLDLNDNDRVIFGSNTIATRTIKLPEGVSKID